MAGAVVRGAGQIAKIAEKVAKESKKHAKDVTTKKKPNQKKTEKATKGQRTYREGQRKAGAVGGTAGYMAGSGNDYSAANVDLNSGKGLPVFTSTHSSLNHFLRAAPFLLFLTATFVTPVFSTHFTAFGYSTRSVRRRPDFVSRLDLLRTSIVSFFSFSFRHL